MDERTDRQIQSLFSIQTAHFKKRGYNNLTEMSFNRTRLYKKQPITIPISLSTSKYDLQLNLVFFNEKDY